MESSESGMSDYAANYMRCNESSKLAVKNGTNFDELCYQTFFNRHKIPYYYQTHRRINGCNRIIVRKIRHFSENTTAHGVRRIFIARNAHTARLWLFGIVLCFIILIVQAHHLVMKFNRHEKITTIEVSKGDYCILRVRYRMPQEVLYTALDTVFHVAL